LLQVIVGEPRSTADSDTRSSTESRKAPNLVAWPTFLATAPSIASNPEAAARAMPPHNRSPRAMITATTRLSKQPITVSAFGVRPRRARKAASGSTNQRET
jgi:hypothetical protein